MRATIIAILLSLSIGAAHGADAASPNYQGLWWNAPGGSESGWGINLAHQADVVFATWFTYDADGKSWWLVVEAGLTAPGVYSGALESTTGPPFNATPFDPSKVTRTPVGTATLTFADIDHATFDYTLNGVTQSKQLVREIWEADPARIPTCVWGAQTDPALATNYQGLWWNTPPESESGWGINFTHQGDIVFGSWFTYDLDGKPWWLVVEAGLAAPGVYAGALETTTGPPFNAIPFDPGKVTRTPVGAATIAFADGNNATFSYTVNGIEGMKRITRETWAPPGTVCATATDQPAPAFDAQLASALPELPLSTIYVTLSGDQSSASFDIEYDLGAGLRVLAPAVIDAPGTLRIGVPPGVFSLETLFAAGTAQARVKRIRATASGAVIEYSNAFAVEIAALPESTQAPGAMTKLLLDVSNELRRGSVNSLVDQGTLDALAANALPKAAIDNLSPGALALSDRLALAYFRNTLGVSLPDAQVSAPPARAKSLFGDVESVVDLARQVAAGARERAQTLSGVGENLILGAAIVAAIAESPVLLSVAAGTTVVGGLAQYVGLSFGTAEGLILDNASQLSSLPVSSWRSSIASLRFFAENAAGIVLGDVEGSAIVDKLGVPEPVWSATQLIIQTSPVDLLLQAVSAQAEQYVLASGTPEEQALFLGDRQARNAAKLEGPLVLPVFQRFFAAQDLFVGALQTLDFSNRDDFDRSSRVVACLQPQTNALAALGLDLNADDPAQASILDDFANAMVRCTVAEFGSLAALPAPRVKVSSPDQNLDYYQSAQCWKGGCNILHTTCSGQEDAPDLCTTVTTPANCTGRWCELSGPPLCPVGLKYREGVVEKCSP